MYFIDFYLFMVLPAFYFTYSYIYKFLKFSSFNYRNGVWNPEICKKDQKVNMYFMWLSFMPRDMDKVYS